MPITLYLSMLHSPTAWIIGLTAFYHCSASESSQIPAICGGNHWQNYFIILFSCCLRALCHVLFKKLSPEDSQSDIFLFVVVGGGGWVIYIHYLCIFIYNFYFLELQYNYIISPLSFPPLNTSHVSPFGSHSNSWLLFLYFYMYVCIRLYSQIYIYMCIYM